MTRSYIKCYSIYLFINIVHAGAKCYNYDYHLSNKTINYTVQHIGLYSVAAPHHAGHGRSNDLVKIAMTAK